MVGDIITRLIFANLAGTAAILLVLAMRRPARRLIGARLSYALWLIVPVAMAACLLPPRKVEVAPTAAAQMVEQAAGLDLEAWLVSGWLAGAVGFLLYVIFGQQRALASLDLTGRDERGFVRAANPAAGPVLIGLFRPTIVLPTNFEQRFAPDERAMILAHERTHLVEGHLWTNALVGVLRALNWFNPLMHLAAYWLRVDQELACDAAVVERHPGERRTYAEAMLKSQLGRTSFPLGCSWPARSTPMLKERIEMLAIDTPKRPRRLAGAAAIALLTAAAGYGAWAAQPPQPVEDPVELKVDMPLPDHQAGRPAAVKSGDISLTNAGSRPLPAPTAGRGQPVDVLMDMPLPPPPPEGFDYIESLRLRPLRPGETRNVVALGGFLPGHGPDLVDEFVPVEEKVDTLISIEFDRNGNPIPGTARVVTD